MSLILTSTNVPTIQTTTPRATSIVFKLRVQNLFATLIAVKVNNWYVIGDIA
jgi:hypothetical protein